MTKALTNPQRALLSTIMTALFAVSLLLAIMPTPARAASLTEPQIQAILSLLVSFNAEPSTVANTEAALRGTTPPTIATSTGSHKDSSTHGLIKSYCDVNYTLGRGDQDEGVGQLQNFLASQGFFTGSTTTFFGPRTEDALKQWQAAQGIATSGTPGTTGWGMFGPKTRSIVARLCNPSSHDNPGVPKTPEGSDRNSGGEHGTASSSASGENHAPTCSLTANQSSVAPGTSVTLTWTSTNATFSSSPNGNTAANGSVTVTPTTSTTYQKTVYGPSGHATCQAMVSVVQPDNASTTPATTTNIQMVMGQPEINLASVATAVAQMPFALAIDSLTNIFVELGVGR